MVSRPKSNGPSVPDDELFSLNDAAEEMPDAAKENSVHSSAAKTHNRVHALVGGVASGGAASVDDLGSPVFEYDFPEPEFVPEEELPVVHAPVDEAQDAGTEQEADDEEAEQESKPATLDSYPEYHSLLAAVVANPDDDVPRLVFADWVDEHAADDVDRAWAELIRVQCGLASNPQDASLRKREENLLKRYRHDLARKLSDSLWHAGEFESFQRGFPTSCHLSSPGYIPREDLVEYWKDTLNRFPIGHLIGPMYSMTPGDFESLMQAPGFRNVHSWSLTSLTEENAKLLEAATQLETLNLSHSRNLSAACLPDIAKLRGLRTLQISTLRHFDAETAARDLSGMEHLEHLEVPQSSAYAFWQVLNAHPDWLPNLKKIDGQNVYESGMKERLERRGRKADED